MISTNPITLSAEDEALCQRVASRPLDYRQAWIADMRRLLARAKAEGERKRSWRLAAILSRLDEIVDAKPKHQKPAARTVKQPYTDDNRVLTAGGKYEREPGEEG